MLVNKNVVHHELFLKAMRNIIAKPARWHSSPEKQLVHAMLKDISIDTVADDKNFSFAIMLSLHKYRHHIERIYYGPLNEDERNLSAAIRVINNLIYV